MESSSSAFLQSIGATLGATLAGPGGALVGNIAGGLLSKVLPDIEDVFNSLLSGIASDAIYSTGKTIIDRVKPSEKKQLNHDLQMAFRDALQIALVEIGGERCFPNEAKAQKHDVPAAIVYPLTPEAHRLWVDKSPLAEQVCWCLHEMTKDLQERNPEKQYLLPLQNVQGTESSHAEYYLQAQTPQALNDDFFKVNIQPFLDQHDSLIRELPEFEHHLRRYLLNRTLFHLGELLKERPSAWRAFNRLMLEGLRAQLSVIEGGLSDIKGELSTHETSQKRMLERIDALLEKSGAQNFAALSDGLATLLSTYGSIEKRVDQGFNDLNTKVAIQHEEVRTGIDHIILGQERIASSQARIEEGFVYFSQRVEEHISMQGSPPISTKTPPAPGDPPFQGLRYFSEEDAERFFGREYLTAQLVERLSQHPFLAVVGASGSGKSSVIRAGLVPALARGGQVYAGIWAPSGSERWSRVIFNPGSQPLESLAASLTKADPAENAAEHLADRLAKKSNSLTLYIRRLLKQQRGSQHLLLIVDQFEEIFTLCKDTARQQAFIDNLMEVVSAGPESRTMLVIALRADFYEQCGQYENLRQGLQTHQAFIGAMTPAELRKAIEGPARLGDWYFEPGLVDLILRDVGSEPGALPHLSLALRETWDHRCGRMMILESYAESGGVRHAITQTAERVYQQFSPEEQILAQHILLRLTQPGEGVPDTRRRASLNDLLSHADHNPLVRPVLKKLADGRLITLESDSAEVAHEALIREWERMQAWIEENRDGLRTHRRLSDATENWLKFNRAPSELYRGVHLDSAQEWAASHADELSKSEAEYLAASREAVDREEREKEEALQRELDQANKLAEEQQRRADAEQQRAQEQTRTAARLRRWAIYLVVALAAALVAAIFALSASTQAVASQKTAIAEAGIRATAQAQAERQALIAQAGELSAIAVSQLDSQLDLALLLTNEAYKESQTIQNMGNLLKAWNHRPEVYRLLFGHRDTVWSVAFSPDGKLLATGGEDGTIRFWEADSWKSIGEPISAHPGGVRAVRFSPDGKMLASGGDDNLVRLWQVDSRKPIGKPFAGHQNWVYTLDFSPDGKLLASGSSDRAAILWDLQSGQQVGEPLLGHKESVSGLAFSPDGASLVTASIDGTLQLWDVKSGQPSGEPFIGHTNWIFSVTFSPDGQKLVSGSADNTVRIWDVQSHQQIGEPLIGHSDWVYAVTFSPDGKLIASGSVGTDHSVRFWDAASGEPVGDPIPSWSEVVSLAYSPDGQFLATGNAGSGPVPVYIYTFNPNQFVRAQFSEQPLYVKAVEFSPDGKYLASGGGSVTTSDAAIRIIDIGQPGSPARLLEGHTDWINCLAFSPDGRTLASASDDHTIRLWDVEDMSAIGELILDKAIMPKQVHFSNDGKMLISGNSDGTVQFWDSQTHQELGETVGVRGDELKTIALSPDGRMLAYAGQDASQTSVIRFIDIESREIIASLTGGHADWILSLAFSPDGETLASGSGDATIRFWDVKSGEMLGDPLSGHVGPVLGLAFSASGELLYSSSADSTWRMWDVKSGQPIGSPVTAHSGTIWGLDISPDGLVLATGGDDAALRLWNVIPEAWMDYNCERAGRNLSQTEWQRFVHWKVFDPNYRSCLQWAAGE